MNVDPSELANNCVGVVAVSKEPESERYCWVCFATDEDDPWASWVRPCNCRGTSKWVHQMCLQRWVDEKQRGNPSAKVSCPQCNTTYIIVYPDMGSFVVFLDTVNAAVYKVCPFIAAGLMVGSIYWVAVTYGAVTVMQVMGQEQGQEFLEMSDPLFLLIILPTIPTCLILGKMFEWEEAVLAFMRRHIPQVPLLKYIFPSFSNELEGGEESLVVPHITDPVSATRILCSALVFPTMATIVGGLLFRTVKPNLQRTAMGAIAFLALKGVLKLYHKQKIYTRQRRRKILDYNIKDVAVQANLPEES